MSQTTTHQQASGHQIRNLRELEHDPYHAKRKLAEPTVCGECGAVYQDGRWQWGEPAAGAAQATCPACQRIEDHCPAGFLTLGGDFLAQHKDEILHLIHNLEAREKSEHALKRIMAIEEQADGSLLATFTDPHLARAAGEAVHDACKGDLDYHYQPGEFLLRVTWKR